MRNLLIATLLAVLAAILVHLAAHSLARAAGVPSAGGRYAGLRVPAATAAMDGLGVGGHGC